MFTLKEYLQGVFNFPVADELITSILCERGFTPDDECANTEKKDRELLVADVLMALSRASQTWANKTGNEAFNMTVSGGLIPLADRQAMRNEANKLYSANGESDKVRLLSAINLYGV